MTRIWLRENKLIWYLLNTRNRIFSILLIIIIFFFSFSFFLLNNMYTAMFPICYLLWSNNTKPSYQISPFHGWHTRETTWLFTLNNNNNNLSHDTATMRHERPEGCREFLDIAWWSIRRTILEQRTMEISKGSMSSIDGGLGKC